MTLQGDMDELRRALAGLRDAVLGDEPVVRLGLLLVPSSIVMVLAMAGDLLGWWALGGEAGTFDKVAFLIVGAGGVVAGVLAIRPGRPG